MTLDKIDNVKEDQRGDFGEEIEAALKTPQNFGRIKSVLVKSFGIKKIEDENISPAKIAESINEEFKDSKNRELPSILTSSKSYFKISDKIFLTFWSKLGQTLALPERKDALKKTINLLENFANNEFRHVRLISTQCSHYLIEGLLKALKYCERNLKICKKRLKGKGEKEKARLELSSLKLHKRNIVKNVESCFEKIFTHRYRDISEVIRIESVLHLGKWVLSCPQIFLNDEKLKHFGWLLHDRNQNVRKIVLASLIRIYEKDQNISKMSNFSERFFGRILEMLDDKCASVIVKAANLIRIFYEKDLLDKTDDDSMTNLLWSKNAKVRSAAADFFLVESFQKIDSDFGVIKKLIELCNKKTFELNEKESKTALFIEVFIPRLPILSDWDSLLQILHSENDQNKLEDNQIAVFVQILLAIVQTENNPKFKKKDENEPKTFDQFFLPFFERLPEFMLSRKFDSATLISLSGIVNSISDKSLSCIDENSANSFREAARSIFSFAAGEDLLKALASSIEKLSKSEISAANSFERFYGELAKEAETNLRKTNLFSGELKFLEEAVSETKRLLALQSQKNVLSDKIWAQIAKLLASFGELWANSKVSSQTRNLERIGKDFLKIAALSLFWDFVGDERNRKRKAPEKTSGKDDNLGKEDNYFSEAKLRNEKKQRISQISKLFQNILDSENCRSLSSTVLKCFGDLCSISDVFLNRDEELNTKICDFFIRFADERVIDGEEADFEKEDIFAACKLVLIDALKFKPILFKLIQIYRISEKELKFILRASISKAISANRRAIGEIVQKYVDERKPVYLQFMEAKERAVLQKLVKNGETDSKVIVEAVFEE